MVLINSKYLQYIFGHYTMLRTRKILGNDWVTIYKLLILVYCPLSHLTILNAIWVEDQDTTNNACTKISGCLWENCTFSFITIYNTRIHLMSILLPVFNLHIWRPSTRKSQESFIARFNISLRITNYTNHYNYIIVHTYSQFRIHVAQMYSNLPKHSEVVF